jgi:hypothetical protein
MSAFFNPVVQGCFGNPEVFGDLGDRSFVFPADRHDIAAELGGKGLAMLNILAARNESLQVR